VPQSEKIRLKDIIFEYILQMKFRY